MDKKSASERAKKAWVARKRRAHADIEVRKKSSEAAKKAWVTRHKDDDPVIAEQQRQEALRILEEMEKHSQDKKV